MRLRPVGIALTLLLAGASRTEATPLFLNGIELPCYCHEVFAPSNPDDDLVQTAEERAADLLHEPEPEIVCEVPPVSRPTPPPPPPVETSEAATRWLLVAGLGMLVLMNPRRGR